MKNKRIHLAWVAGIGPDGGQVQGAAHAWCRPNVYVELVRAMERASVDFVLLRESVRTSLNPSVLTPVLTMNTSTIGIVPTLAPADYPPFLMARLVLTLDHVAGGRTGWGVDPSMAGPAGYAHPLKAPASPELRYEIAAEYVDVCKKLWASWEPDAVVSDIEAGIFADPAKVNPIDHDGKHFRVKGPMTMPQSNRGAPLLVQTATSEDDLRFAGANLDVAIIRGADLKDIVRARDIVRDSASSAGRPRDRVKVYFAVNLKVTQDPALAAAWAPTDGKLAIAGSGDEVATGLENAFDASGCDGVAIVSDWDPLSVANICNTVLGTLRQRGRVAMRSQSPAPKQSFRNYVLSGSTPTDAAHSAA